MKKDIKVLEREIERQKYKLASFIQEQIFDTRHKINALYDYKFELQRELTKVLGDEKKDCEKCERKEDCLGKHGMEFNSLCIVHDSISCLNFIKKKK